MDKGSRWKAWFLQSRALKPHAQTTRPSNLSITKFHSKYDDHSSGELHIESDEYSSENYTQDLNSMNLTCLIINPWNILDRCYSSTEIIVRINQQLSYSSMDHKSYHVLQPCNKLVGLVIQWRISQQYISTDIDLGTEDRSADEMPNNETGSGRR